MTRAVDAPPLLLERVLRPYKPDCRYLRTAEVIGSGDLFHSEPFVQRYEFAIDASCYIDDTGHFNAVEFNICFNQMFYVAVATLVADGSPGPFESWTLEDYWERQLPKILITDFSSRFRRPISARAFSGELRLTKAVQRTPVDDKPGMLIISTECRFWDATGGAAEGQVRIVILDPPPAVPQ
ncbi:FcoT family thioesterase [Kitasatospora sp. RB6PN24]|uniref:FcoT family thioesterase n=1 Tax=Kitasatospora humi TaxID=2893891 RepID=UPI001E35553E|nr:FcoT family thioesterase [Kitasatospora humi]MCC9306024.1 FcoT family thioesterase [Kitasatospora humi]